MSKEDEENVENKTMHARWNKKMKNIYVMPTVKECTDNKTCICRNNAGKEST